MALYLCRVVTLDTIWINVVAIKRQIRLAFLWKYWVRFIFFWNEKKAKKYMEHSDMELWYLSVHCIYWNSIISSFSKVYCSQTELHFPEINFDLAYISKNARLTFVIIPYVPRRENFFAFWTFIRSFSLETKLVLTRVAS